MFMVTPRLIVYRLLTVSQNDLPQQNLCWTVHKVWLLTISAFSLHSNPVTWLAWGDKRKINRAWITIKCLNDFFLLDTYFQWRKGQLVQNIGTLFLQQSSGLPTFRNKKTEYTNRMESRNPNAGGQGARVGPLVGSRQGSKGAEPPWSYRIFVKFNLKK